MPKATRRNQNDMSPDNSRLKVWYSKMCPYAQRVTFALHYKSVDYELIEVDMKNKPPELLEINPNGQVPAMIDQGYKLYESNICVEYIDETWESPSRCDILPKEPGEKARARMWCDFIEKKVITPFFCMRKEEERENAKQKVLNGFSTISNEFLKSGGPYFAGSKIGLVDIALAPFINRLIIAEYFFNFKVPQTEKYIGFHKWWENIQQHPSYMATKVDDNVMIEYVKNKIKSGAPCTR